MTPELVRRRAPTPLAGPADLVRLLPRRASWDRLRAGAASSDVRLAAAGLLLASVALAGLATSPVFVDEADNVLGACLQARGLLAYRDYFSHHFPLPYYLLALLGEGGACSLVAGRLVAMASLVLAGAVFAWVARNPLAPLALLLVCLAAPAYYLQLFLAETLLSAGLIVCLALLTERGSRAIGPVGNVVRVAALVLLTSSSPLGLMMAALVMPLMVFGAGPRWRPVLACCAVALLLWPTVLAVQGTLTSFVEQAVLFNVQVYSRYLDVRLTDPGSLLHHSLTFVRHRFTFVMDWLAGQDTKATPASFAAFLEMLLIVLLGVLVARRRDEGLFRLGVGLLFPLAVAREGFHMAPFIALAGFGCVQLLPRAPRANVVTATAVAALVVALRLYLFALPAEGAGQDGLAQSLHADPKVVQHARPHDGVLFLPIGPQGYLANERAPGSFYTFFLPWQAEQPGAEDRLIADIEQNRVAVIVLDQEAAVWGRYQFREYAPRVHAHILSAYRPADGASPRRARVFVRN